MLNHEDEWAPFVAATYTPRRGPWLMAAMSRARPSCSQKRIVHEPSQRRSMWWSDVPDSARYVAPTYSRGGRGPGPSSSHAAIEVGRVAPDAFGPSGSGGRSV